METQVRPGTMVAVVGAGPAGLEAACTAAERGAKVMLFDASDAIGGAARDASRFPDKSMNGYLLSYYSQRLDRAGVEVQLSTQLDDLTELDPSVGVVIVATGARLAATPWHDRNDSWDAPWDGPELFEGRWHELLERDVEGATVVLVEAEPVDYIATTVATHLIAKQARLHIVTSFGTFAGMLDGPANDRISRLIAAHSVPVYGTSHLLPSTDGIVRIRHKGLKNDYEIPGVSLVVSTGLRQSVTLPTGPTGNARKVFHAGDCVAPRGIAQAVREGHDAALSV